MLVNEVNSIHKPDPGALAPLFLTSISPTMPVIKDTIKDFKNHCLFEKNLSPKTMKAYSTDLQQFLSFFEKNGVIKISQVTKIELREYLESISALKPKSIKRKIATVKALFNFLEFDDQILLNPFRKIKINIKEPRLLPVTLELSEIGKILKLLYKKLKAIPNNDSYTFKEAVRNVVVIELLFATGGRVSEIATIKDQFINLNSGVIILTGKGSKERIIQVCNQETITFLKLYRKLWQKEIENSIGYFLINRSGNMLSDQSIRNLVKNVSIESGISKKVTPHVFRHSFATLLLEKDVDIKYIQSLLGHSSIITTQIYTHVSKSKQRQLLRTKHPRKDLLAINYEQSE